jgi:hypothetical protein
MQMGGKRPTTIAAYIRAAPRAGQPHLRRLYAILKSVAPEAQETIKWGSHHRQIGGISGSDWDKVPR